MSLILDHVSHVYGDDTALAVKALDDVSLEIPDGQFIGLRFFLQQMAPVNPRWCSI